MTKGTKRVDELEVGDIIITPGCKGTSTVSHIEKVGFREYRIICRGIRQALFYYDNVEVPYLGNKKEEETMIEMNKVRHTQKVDCSALHPYFDALTNDEATLKHTNIPVYVKQQLRNIHELFEGVLGLTLEEVKTLYFERKTGKQETSKTKKVYELISGDVVIEPNCSSWKIVSKVEIANKECGVYRVFYETDSPPNLGTHRHDAVFIYLHNVSELENKPKTKKVKELKEGDVFQYGKYTSTVSRVENEPSIDSVRLYFYQMGNPSTLPKDLEVVVLN